MDKSGLLSLRKSKSRSRLLGTAVPVTHRVAGIGLLEHIVRNVSKPLGEHGEAAKRCYIYSYAVCLVRRPLAAERIVTYAAG